MTTATVSPSGRLSRMLRGTAWALTPLVGLAVAGFAWWLAASVFHVSTYVLPAPGEVVHSFMQLPAYLMRQTGITILESLEGFVAAMVGGVLLGALLGTSRLLERSFLPLLMAANASPKVALLPLLLVWFGFGMPSKVILALLLAVFPVLLSTVSGLKSTPMEMVELGRSLSASRWQAFARLRLPHALAQIFVGFRIAMPLAVVGAIIAELSNSSRGLGFVLANSAGSGDVALAFAAFALASLVGIVLFYLVVVVEWVALPWVRATTARA